MSHHSQRPQRDPGDGSSSASAPLTTESSGSGPSRLSPHEPRTTDGTGTETDVHAKQPKRRKVPETVTRNACSNCKKARAKCDGQTPCSRCFNRKESDLCAYEMHTKHQKEEMVKQIKRFQDQEHLTTKVLEAIASGSKQTSNIIQWLRSGDSLTTIVESLTSLERSSQDVPMEDVSPGGLTNEALNLLDGRSEQTWTGYHWTAVTADERVLRHLFSLYFTWIHPVYTLFSEGAFFDSLQTRSWKHCSPVLVNAICAMACQLHTKQRDQKDRIDYESLGVQFMGAARSLARLEVDDLKTVQALDIMFLFEYSNSNGHRASAYLRIATRMLGRMKLPVQDCCLENCSQDTICGTQNLNVEWAQMTSQAPIYSLDVSIGSHSRDALMAKDNIHWYYYRFETDEPPAWPCLLATTTQERAKLVGIIRDVTELYHGYRQLTISAFQVLELHKRYVNWREQLPPSLVNFETHSQALPHVLTMLILFHTAVTQLLRPLLSLGGLPLETMMAVEEEIWRHAQMGLDLLDRHYRTHWTCRYQPVQQLFSVLHLSEIMARFFAGRTDPNSRNGLEALQLAMDVFRESQGSFAISIQFQDVLYHVANECSFDVPSDWKSQAPPTGTFSHNIDHTIEACGNASFLQPANDVLVKYQSTFAYDWVTEAPAYNFRAKDRVTRRRKPLDSDELAAENLMSIRNIVHTT